MVTARRIRYRDAGVNIDEAGRAVAAIKKMAQRTFTPAVLTQIGTFGACYALSGWKKPVLVSSVDGVGTKLKIAFATGRHDTIGQDLVNHCVNDVAVQGAVPLFFLDYLAVGKLVAETAASVISGIARACRENACALIGGETAEMPGLYANGEYDLAGTIVGVAERSDLITGRTTRGGDVLIGLPSTGLHTNGYSLARKLLFEIAGFQPNTWRHELGTTIAEELLKIHRSYLKPIRALVAARLLKAAAHITGGGITDNTPRMLPEPFGAVIDVSAWPVPPIFNLLREIGNMPEEDWRRTLNLGVGMILAVGEKDAVKAERLLKKMGEPCFILGHVVRLHRGGPRLEYR
ncbi:MAG TPA: phosphoribosylformylglycinamidine cyclo-ligase [Bryobacteraceae bacterium]|nr:phosphoribosylformylglycinamidine cyclo-ligase [Bryobacteraceae bacterium]